MVNDFYETSFQTFLSKVLSAQFVKDYQGNPNQNIIDFSGSYRKKYAKIIDAFTSGQLNRLTPDEAKLLSNVIKGVKKEFDIRGRDFSLKIKHYNNLDTH